jgi:hypothetical protein
MPSRDSREENGEPGDETTSQWQKLVTLLEDLSDRREIDRVRKAGEETIPWEQARAELRAQCVDV